MIGKRIAKVKYRGSSVTLIIEEKAEPEFKEAWALLPGIALKIFFGDELPPWPLHAVKVTGVSVVHHFES